MLPSPSKGYLAKGRKSVPLTKQVLGVGAGGGL